MTAEKTPFNYDIHFNSETHVGIAAAYDGESVVIDVLYLDIYHDEVELFSDITALYQMHEERRDSWGVLFDFAADTIFVQALTTSTAYHKAFDRRELFVANEKYLHNGWLIVRVFLLQKDVAEQIMTYTVDHDHCFVRGQTGLVEMEEKLFGHRN